MRIVFMGSPDFALPTLRRLIESEYEIVGVVTQPDRPAGRGRTLRPPPAKELALAHHVPVFQPERVNTPDALADLRELAPEVLVIAAYGQILKQSLLDIPSRGALNVHASLLPRHRGAAPSAAAIIAGDKETGVTILEVIRKLDAGPVLAQRSLPIAPLDTTGSLNEGLATLGAALLIEILPAWARRELSAQSQDDTHTTYAPTIQRSDAAIDWSLPAADVWRQVRAYNPWPIAGTTLDNETLRIFEAWPLDLDDAAPPGAVLPLPDTAEAPSGAGFAVRCGQGSLAIVRAQRPGRRVVTGVELLRGFRGLLQKRLGTE